MEKKQVELGDPVTCSGLTIVPVVQTVVRSWSDHRPAAFMGVKKPLYILVYSPSRPVQAFTLEGTLVSLEQIQAEYPELKARLDKLHL